MKLRDAAIQLGLCANPDESWLTLRGLRTLPVRLEKQALTAYRMARWLQSCAPVARVLHPALEDCPGHDNWLRDFSGAGCLFGVVLQPEISDAAMRAMLDRLKIFSIGASWGGYESLVMPISGALCAITPIIIYPAPPSAFRSASKTLKRLKRISPRPWRFCIKSIGAERRALPSDAPAPETESRPGPQGCAPHGPAASSRGRRGVISCRSPLTETAHRL
ncbi:hypothetical protein DOFOFD_11080 [Acetobacteraceae bacterium EV16P]|uniref:Uncharacterized protein n=1 Tax=Sorlinia euscelidii TaxID=3081148 RepID=A0ABU7U3X1_9PROT